MHNYSYRRFLSVAGEELQDCLAKGVAFAEKAGVSVRLNQGFPWKDDFVTAVGRCGLDDDGDYLISVHFRAIYDAVRDIIDGTYWDETEWDWERESREGVRSTFWHELGHALFHKFLDLTSEDDDLWEWCKVNGYDATLFREGCDAVDFQEEVAEAFCRDSGSLLRRFVEDFAKNYCKAA